MPDLTLMAVHAHPDDESLGTGGTLARYAAEGVRTVLVTCTDGGCGDGHEGSKPGDPRHDRSAVVALRRQELERSCRALGVADLEMLGYRDSGMMGWPDNEAPGSFWTTPVGDAASRIADLLRRYRPQVVVTYDPQGFYGHPDHIQTHRATMAAVEMTGIPDKVYYTAVPRSRMAEFARRMRELGMGPGSEDGGGRDGAGADGAGADGEGREGGSEGSSPEEWGTPDHEVTTYVDIGAYTGRKYDSIECHASQADNIFFLRMGRQAFSELMRTETYVRARDRTGTPVPESDLFSGLR